MFPSNDIYADIVTPNSKQEEPSLPFFHFPSPCSYYELGVVPEENDLFLHQDYHDDLLFHQPLRSSEDSISETVIYNMPDSSKIDQSMIDCSGAKSENVSKQAPRKRANKGDRHSKINTAQGPRDRRMRLSLEVARKFFGLQDMLGYDKASKTVEWLLLQAKPEIEKLFPPHSSYSTTIPARSSSSTSECEVVSGSTSKGKPSTKDKKMRRQPRLCALARDLRKMARARAKARTEEKKLRSEKLYESKVERNDLVNQLSCWHKMNPSLMEVVAEDEEEPRSHGRQHLDESLGIMSQNTIFTCLQNSGIPQEQHVIDFQAFGKSWEPYNSQNVY